MVEFPLGHLWSLSSSAAGAVGLVPRIAEDVNRKRIEKIRQARLDQPEGETLGNSPKTGTEPEAAVSSRVIAASMMGVNDNYVGLAQRVKQASPQLFEEVRAGEITLSAAIRRLDGLTDLDRLEALVAEFADS